jgi:hypothetical protein
MRAREFITEGQVEGLQADVAAALPATYSIPALQNQDPYLQYRFGVALAATKGKYGSEQAGEDVRHDMDPRTAWGENQIIVSYDPHIADWIDAALKEVGLSPSDKKLISTPNSEEQKDTGIRSPVVAFKGYPR